MAHENRFEPTAGHMSISSGAFLTVSRLTICAGIVLVLTRLIWSR